MDKIIVNCGHLDKLCLGGGCVGGGDAETLIRPLSTFIQTSAIFIGVHYQIIHEMTKEIEHLTTNDETSHSQIIIIRYQSQMSQFNVRIHEQYTTDIP